MSENRKVSFDNNLLHHIRYGRDDMAQAMVTEDLCKASDHWGTLLHYAAFHGNDVIINHLIELGSNVDAVDSAGRTPLMVAIAREQVEVVKVLLESSADIDLANVDGVSALQMVLDSRYFKPSILRVFLDTVQGEAFSDEDLVDRLIQAGCSLYHAASLKNLDVMWLMLSRGVDVNSRGYHGKTALHAAVEMYDLKLASMLAENDADANILDEDGTTPLFIAASLGRNHMVKLLLENGADPNIEDLETGHTPFSAVYTNSTVGLEDRFFDCAELLLLHGANPQNSPQDHHTLLDHALLHRDSAKIKLLIAHLALLDVTGTPTAKSVIRCNVEKHTEEYPTFEEYFEACQQTLKLKLLGKWTMLDFMTADERKLRTFARNYRLIPKMFDIFVEQNLSDEFPYYFNILWSRVSRTVNAVKLEDNAIGVICQIFNADHSACCVVAREVTSYLSVLDLEQLCRVSNL